MSKTCFILFIILAFIVFSPLIYVHAEPQLETVYNYTYGSQSSSEIAYFAVETEDGFLVVGQTASYETGNGDISLIKTDQSGTPLWNKTYGTTASEDGVYVIKTRDGNYLITGRTNSNGNIDLLLLKVTPDGNMLWNKTIGGPGDDWMWKISRANTDGYVLVGRTNSYGVGLTDIWLIKIDENGDLLWNVTLGGSEEDRGRDIYTLDNGGYLVLGFSSSYGHGGFDFWLIETDSSGEMIWNNTYGGPEADRAFCLKPIDDGYVLSGSTNSFAEGGSYAYFFGLDSERNMIWNKTYGGEGIDSAHNILDASNGEYLLVGYTGSSGAGARDVYVILTDDTGNPILEKTYGGPEAEVSSFGIKTKNGDFLLGGSTTINGNEDLFLLRLREVEPTPELSPANLVYRSLSVDSPEITLGQSVTVTLHIENIGDISGSIEVELYVNDVVYETRSITVDGDGSKTEKFTITPDKSGTVEVKVGSLSESFTVSEAEPPQEPEPTNNGIPGFSILSMLIALIMLQISYAKAQKSHFSHKG